MRQVLRPFPLKLKKVLVVHKKSTYQIQAEEHKEARFLKLIEEGNEVVNRVRVAHEEHVDTLARIEDELSVRGIEFQSLSRSQVDETVENVDLCISVGGDGTFLDASHALKDIPALGVNSSRSSSFGHFCMANRENFSSILDQIETEMIAPINVLRLQIAINNKPVKELVLNEVLVAHSSPAATSRYLIEVGDEKEEQRSSGLWIGTPGGSTGSLRSAGGQIMNLPARQYQYLVREACMRPGQSWRLLSGVLDENQSMRIVSEMRTGEVYIDGPHIIHTLTLGDELVIQPSPHNLKAFIHSSVNDVFLKAKH